MKKIAVLGSTGSVGENTLRVIEAAPERFQAVGLASGRNYSRLAKQIKQYRPSLVSVAGEAEAAELSKLLGPEAPEMVTGEAGLCRLAAWAEPDVVVMAVAGSAAIAPTLAAVEAGKTVALANKECLVMAGELIMAAAARTGARLLPVDSEHAGVFQALAGRPLEQVRRVLLPASGGPFLDADPTELERATPEAALRHPTWSMGKKISIDSATLMNKALEIIEAHWLFGIVAARLEVVIHPECVVHALVEFEDGAVIAQLSCPDMRLPILHALAWPERIDAGLPRLDLAGRGRLSFRALDSVRFSAPGLAYRALEKGGTAPAALAAADEAAVAAFLENRITFTRIVPLVAEVLAAHSPRPLDDLSRVREAETWARLEVQQRAGAKP